MPDSRSMRHPVAPIPSDVHYWFSSDVQFHQLYPEHIQNLAARHWTPLHIANLAIQFLVPYDGVKVLDIGSGVGKFALSAAYYKPKALLYGAEQRGHLVAHAKKARRTLGLENAFFFHLNITQLDFRQFNHFYFYNSFYENLLDNERIDDTITYSPHLYSYYHGILYKKLNEMPIGTRVVTFHCLEGKIPPGYQLIEQHMGTLLKCWMKI